jgi:peptide/nickel transport system permease protein
MSQYIIRRLLTAIPTVLLISLVIFTVLDLAPGDPTSALPLSIPQDVREKIRESLGLNQSFSIRYVKWMQQFFVNEPLNALEKVTGLKLGNSEERLRITSWTSRGKPVVDLILERLPQTLWVVGLAYLFSVLIAIPLGVMAAVKQNSILLASHCPPSLPA